MIRKAKYTIILILSLILPLNIYSGNIGTCGHPVFLEREKTIDSFIIRLKNANKKEIKNNIINTIINTFGYIGIENLIRYNEKQLAEVFKQLLKSDNFYVKFKSIYGLGNTGEPSDAKYIQQFLKSTNLLLKDIAISAIWKLKARDKISFLKDMLAQEKNIYIKNSLEFAIKILEGKLSPTFRNFGYGIIKKPLNKFIYHKYNEPIKNYEEKYSVIYLPEKEIPTADDFVPPIINYTKELIFKTRRISFGVGKDIVHTGDDCGWFREGNSVYAIANGIVRLIHHSPDWGFIIVIEHKLPDGNFLCSIYGHLSRNIYLRAGQIVRMAEKIGEIGLSYSVDNGGYGAHLHFGISKGPWLKPGINLGKNIMVSSQGGKIQKIKEYKITKNGIEITYENGIKLVLSENTTDFSTYLFWLKGYQFAKDVERIWVDPYEFLKKNSSLWQELK